MNFSKNYCIKEELDMFCHGFREQDSGGSCRMMWSSSIQAELASEWKQTDVLEEIHCRTDRSSEGVFQPRLL